MLEHTSAVFVEDSQKCLFSHAAISKFEAWF